MIRRLLIVASAIALPLMAVRHPLPVLAEQAAQPPAATPEPFELVGELDGTSGVAVAFSGDGKRIVTADQRACRVWDVKTLKPLTPPLVHGGTISGASIDRDGSRVLTWGAAVEIRHGGGHLRGTGARVWSVKTGKLLMEVASHAEGHPVWNAAMSPDGTQVATCAEGDPNVRVWDAVTGEPLFGLAMPREVEFVMYSPDGSRILAFESGRAAARQFDVKTREPVGGILPANADRSRGVTRPACYSVDGKILVLADSDTLYVYDADRNVEISKIREDMIPSRGIFTSVDITPDGRLVAATALGYGSKVWTARNAEAQTDMLGGAGSGQAALSPDGKYLVFGGTDDQFAGICDVATGRTIERLPHIGWFSRVCFSPDGNLLALASDSQKLTCIMKRVEDRAASGK